MSAENPIDGTPQIENVTIMLRQKNINAGRNLLQLPQTDLEIFESIDTMRKEIEDPDSWMALRAKAEEEISLLDPATLDDMIREYAPYLIELPASHSIGHVADDTIHLARIIGCISDEDGATLSEAELIAGVIAGKFHDCAVALIPRYEDNLHFASHADVGAYMLGILGKDTIPPHLLKMAQFAIAAHTNYLHEFEISRDEMTRTKRPFHTAGKPAVSIARSSDRGDITSIPIVWRHLLGVLDGGYHTTSDKGFAYVEASDEALIAQYDPSAPDVQGNHVGLMRKYVMSTHIGSPYTIDDLPSIVTHFLIPNAKSLDVFARTLSEEAAIHPAESAQEIERFLRLCRLQEPGVDIDSKIERLRHILTQLPESWKCSWAHAFHFLTHDLLHTLHNDMMQEIDAYPQWLKAKSPTTQEFIIRLKRKAKLLLYAKDPKYLDIQTFTDADLPSLYEVLMQS